MKRVRAIATGALLLAAASVLLSAYLFSRIQGESASRRSQSCVVAERRYADDVRQLKGTYRYLAEISPVERTSTLNVTILRGLPDTERRVRIDRAPPYCDEPGIGLKGEAPLVPARPRNLNP